MKTLVLSFGTDLNKTYQVTVTNPKEDLSQEEVAQAMQEMIAANILAVPSGRLANIKAAKYVEKYETDIIA